MAEAVGTAAAGLALPAAAVIGAARLAAAVELAAAAQSAARLAGVAARTFALSIVANAGTGLTAAIEPAAFGLAWVATAIIGAAGFFFTIGGADASALLALLLSARAAAAQAAMAAAIIGATGFALAVRLAAAGRFINGAVAVVVPAVAEGL